MRFTRTLAVLAALTLLGTIVACSPASSQDPAALKGTQWVLSASSETQGDLTKLGIMTKFDDTNMSGFSGVNSYSGPYKAGDDGSFEAGPFASTMMAGPQAAMAAEAVYLKVIDAANKYQVKDGKLTLTTSEGKSVTYDAAKAFTLPGSSWTVTGYNNGKEAVVGAVEGSDLTLQFGTDSTVSGNGGVNSFNGPFESGDTSIKIGPLASTKMAGPDNLMAQEQQYLTALQAATEWEVANGVLTLRDAKGAMQVTATAK